MIVIDGNQISSIIRCISLSRISHVFSQKLGRLVHVNLIVKFLVGFFMTIWRFYYAGICSQIKADVYYESINFPSARSSNRRKWRYRSEYSSASQSYRGLDFVLFLVLTQKTEVCKSNCEWSFRPNINYDMIFRDVVIDGLRPIFRVVVIDWKWTSIIDHVQVNTMCACNIRRYSSSILDENSDYSRPWNWNEILKSTHDR